MHFIMSFYTLQFNYIMLHLYISKYSPSFAEFLFLGTNPNW